MLAVVAAVVFGALLVPALTAAPASAYTAFWSPGRDVGCVVDFSYARCDTRRGTWSPPPRPAWCRLEFGQGLVVNRSGVAGLTCADDTALLARFSRILPYNRLVRRGRIGCRSTRRGMLCTNYATRTGFLVSRAGYRLYRGGG